MNRRDFIRGTVIGTTAAAATALVQLATPEEAEALAIKDPVILPPTEPSKVIPPPGEFVYVRDNKGNYLSIGIFVGMDMKLREANVTQHKDTTEVLRPDVAGLRGIVLMQGWGTTVHRG